MSEYDPQEWADDEADAKWIGTLDPESDRAAELREWHRRGRWSGGASHLVVLGSHRDSTHAAVVAAPALFSASPPPVIHPRLAAYPDEP